MHSYCDYICKIKLYCAVTCVEVSILKSSHNYYSVCEYVCMCLHMCAYGVYQCVCVLWIHVCVCIVCGMC